MHFSPRWIALLGFQDQPLGNTPEDWFQRVHPDDRDQLLRSIELAQREGPDEFDLQYRLRHRDGTYRWMSSHSTVVRNEIGQPVRLMGSQFDETVETVTDPLTGLPNRLLLLDRLTQSIDRGQRYKGFHFAILLIDVGRPAAPLRSSTTGDPMLTAVARRLETCLRIPDPTSSLRNNDLVARLQADHFAILLDGLKDVSQAKAVADRILDELLKPFALRGEEVRLPVSIGIAVSVTGYARADDVLRDAEIALLRAQVLGGSHCAVFDTAILNSEQTELQLEGDFEQALERGEFELLYQPIVSLTSNQVGGFEALVRWQHPVLGVIAPLDFIPIAERVGFIVPLGAWILREACAQLRAWQTSLPSSKEMWVSVNLSSVQFRNPTLMEQVREALRASTLEPRSLVLELTEGIAMENPTAAQSVLMQLRSMGIRICIDDFGTGYSSLAYLRQFPVDTLKVDRSFVRGMETHHDIAEIVGGLTAMAKQLGLDVVVEGIENKDQLKLLRSLHCEFAQGFLFAKPLAVNAAEDLIKTGLPAQAEERVAAPRLEGRETEPRLESISRSRGRRHFVAAGIALLAAAVPTVLFKGRATDISSISLPRPNRMDAAQDASTGSAMANRPGTDESTSPVVALTRREDLADTSSIAPQSQVASPRVPTPARGGTSMSEAEAGIPATSALTSIEVLHLHRIGGCRGRLTVSREGVKFVPDEGDDVFGFTYVEFIHTLADNTLTVRSASRTYRFREIDGLNKKGPQLQDVVASIARFR